MFNLVRAAVRAESNAVGSTAVRMAVTRTRIIVGPEWRAMKHLWSIPGRLLRVTLRCEPVISIKSAEHAINPHSHDSAATPL